MSRNPAWMGEPMLQQFFAATVAMGGEARVVGGAVRDFLMGRASGDLDVASTLTPEQTMELAVANGWKAIPTGLAHGTVTVVLPGRVIEVTTLRRDVETDGRHAKVEYTNRFEEDAARRDFTFNALYMDAQGEVFDFFDGKKDLAEKRVKFIGDAATRITEDGLRILRYFRFLATHGSIASAAELEVIRQKREMLRSLSGERIAMEMGKLLSARDPSYSVAQMAACDLAPLLSDTHWNAQKLQQLVSLETQYKTVPNAWVRLLAMIAPGERVQAAAWISERYKVSRADRTQLAQLAVPRPAVSEAELKEQLRAQARGVVEGSLLLAEIDGVVGASFESLLRLTREWAVPNFPVSAGDLIAQGFKEGLELGDTLRVLERKWIESDYTLTKEALLQTIV